MSGEVVTRTELYGSLGEAYQGILAMEEAGWAVQQVVSGQLHVMVVFRRVR